MKKNVERSKELVPAIMRRARLDPANEYFFRRFAPANWRDYLVSAITVLALVALGMAQWIIGDNPLLSVIALSLALIALLYQFYKAKVYWMHSLKAI